MEIFHSLFRESGADNSNRIVWWTQNAGMTAHALPQVRTCASGCGVLEVKERKDKQSVFLFAAPGEGNENISREVVWKCYGGQWRAQG